MAVSYNGLWKLLIDKKMKKVDMMNQVGISSSTVAKMTNDELVSMKVLEKICEKLDCDFGDIVHYERKPQSGCVHEQVAKADCECPLCQEKKDGGQKWNTVYDLHQNYFGCKNPEKQQLIFWKVLARQTSARLPGRKISIR